jgi:LysR family transcriptional regulator, flagellar master operon regulator
VNIGWLGVQLILQNGGSCFLPLRMARPLLEEGKLYPLPGSPQFQLPVYMVYARHSESAVIDQALTGLRELAAGERPIAKG